MLSLRLSLRYTTYYRLFSLATCLLLVNPAISWAESKTPLQTTEAVLKEMPNYLQTEGTVEAINQATINAQTSGTIIKINYDINDFVEKGAVLLEFKGVRNQAALDQAKAAVNTAQVMLTDARNEYNRVKSLADKKLVAVSQLDKAKAGLEAAESQTQAAKAGLAAAADQAGDTIVRAPFSGFVIQRHIELGENAMPGKPLFTGVSLNQLRVLTHIPQSFVSTVQQRQSAQILIGGPDSTEQPLKVKQMTIFPFAEKGSRHVGVRLNLEEGVTGLLPGMLVKAQFDLGNKPRLLLNRAAVFQRSEVNGVYIVNADGKISLRQVRLGNPYPENQIEILAGLEAGEKVALDPILAGQQLKAQLAGGS